MHFHTNLCGVEDSVENYQTHLFACLRLWCSSPMESFYFRYVSHISISFMIFMLNYAFTHILFSLRILLLAVEMSDRQASDKLLSRTLYIGPVLLHILFYKYAKKMPYIMYYLHHYQRDGDSKLTGILNKTLSRIKADSKNAVLAPRQP